VFLELIIDPACSIIFEAEKEEKNVMNRPPKDINEPFFGAKKIWLSCSQGIGILVIVFAVYFFGLKMGYSEQEDRALAFTTLIAANIAVIISNRSWTRNIFQILLTSNKTVKYVVGGAAFFLILILNVPFLLELFQFEKISLTEALICIAAGFSSIIWFEMYKVWRSWGRGI
jgi:Ca2+-transporting ATPase